MRTWAAIAPTDVSTRPAVAAIPSGRNASPTSAPVAPAISSQADHAPPGRVDGETVARGERLLLPG